MRARRISRAAVGFAKAVRRDGDRWFVTTGGGELAIRIVTVLYGLVSERTACRCDKRVARAEELGRIQRGKPRLPLAGAREATREMESLYETARLMRSHPAYCVPADILGGVRAALDGCSRTPRVMPGRFAENAPARPLEWGRVFPALRSWDCVLA